MSKEKEMNNTEICEETIEKDRSEEGCLPADDKFYTLTMAEILERQGLKKDAMKIYQVLLRKAGQNNLAIQHRIERLMEGSNGKIPSEDFNERKKHFINWIDKLQHKGN